MIDPDVNCNESSVEKNPKVDRDLQPLVNERYDSLTSFVCSYLQHHINNKLTVVEGNLAYAQKLVEDLDTIHTEDSESRRRLKALQTGLRESLNPIEEALEKIHSIREKAEQYIRMIA